LLITNDVKLYRVENEWQFNQGKIYTHATNYR